MTIGLALAGLAAEGRPERRELDGAVRATLDTFGVMIAGTRQDSGRAAQAAVRSVEHDGASTVIPGGRASAERAALANGIAAHSCELDDFHRGSMVHPGTVIIPAALAVAEEVGSTGRQFLEAVVIGYEVAIRVGLAASVGLYRRGFHPTGVAGVVGAAAAAARLFGLDGTATANGLGLATTRAAGLLVYKLAGDWSKRAQAGFAASAGIECARLARHGFSGPSAGIEGRAGLLEAYVGGGDPDAALDGLGQRWHIRDVSVKPYPACRYTHAPIDALLTAMGGRRVAQSDIDRIEVRTHEQAITSLMLPADRKYAPRTTVDGQFSLPYCLAVVAVRGGIALEDFSAAALRDPAVLDVASRVRASAADEFTRAFPAHQGAEVVLVTGAAQRRAVVRDATGDPENPMTEDGLARKFSACVSPSLGDAGAERLLGAIRGLDVAPDLGELSAALSAEVVLA